VCTSDPRNQPGAFHGQQSTYNWTVGAWRILNSCEVRARGGPRCNTMDARHGSLGDSHSRGRKLDFCKSEGFRCTVVGKVLSAIGIRDHVCGLG
jgi:hypothetical protein